MFSTNIAPPLLSWPRMTSLACAVLVTLGSGTNYIYSAYSPQLGSRLGISHTKLNIIGLGGNLGVYGTGPISGRIVDARGPRLLLGSAFVLSLVGYTGIWNIYESGLPTGTKSLSQFTLYVLVFCSFLTGVGGNSGAAAAINSTAKSFPDRLRATTTALVISGFGLSAFLFSTVAHAAFPGNTSALLVLLALGTSFPMILGLFFVHPVPLPASELMPRRGGGRHFVYDDDEGEVAAIAAGTSLIFRREDDSHAALLPKTTVMPSFDIEETAPAPAVTDPSLPVSAFGDGIDAANSVELSETRSDFGSPGLEMMVDASRRTAGFHDTERDVSGFHMLKTLDFWLLFATMSLLAGTGLMYINNVGSISQALLAKGGADYDDKVASQWQAAQVSTVSIMNCLGRILSGLTADYIKNKLRQPRTFCAVLVAFLFVISQLTCLSINDVRGLWMASVILGLAYGGLFGVFPTLTIEYFGLPHFSENWGYLSLAPVLAANVFSIAFGRNLDAHTPQHALSTRAAAPPSSSPPPTPPTPRPPHERQCLEGSRCYASSLHMTVAACLCALALALWAAYRDKRKMAQRAAGIAGVKAPPPRRLSSSEVVWEDTSEE